MKALAQDRNCSPAVRPWRPHRSPQRSTETSRKPFRTTINFYWSHGKSETSGKKGSARDPNHLNSWVKRGGGRVMAWVYMAASGTFSRTFIADGPRDGSNRTNSDVWMHFILDVNQHNLSILMGRNFIMQQDNDPEHTNTPEDFIRGKGTSSELQTVPI